MEQWKSDDFSNPSSAPSSSSHPPSNSDSRQRTDSEADPSAAARKYQKANREKLRRDRLNEHFVELGNTLDPDRPKHDKATILVDSIQVLKDLTAEVNRLKGEYTALSDESRELTSEKNELREEKVCLKSDIDGLTTQCQQRARVVFPWPAIEPPPVVMAPPYSYPYPPPGAFPYFPGQNPSSISNLCTNFVPYRAPTNHPVERPTPQYTSTSHVSSKQDPKSKPSDQKKASGDVMDRCNGSDDVATELELKMPGSLAQQDLSSSVGQKGKQSQRKEKTGADGSSSSRYSSQVLQDSSSNSVGDLPTSNK